MLFALVLELAFTRDDDTHHVTHFVPIRRIVAADSEADARAYAIRDALDRHAANPAPWSSMEVTISSITETQTA